jgi:predicted glycosyltransferase involved in capsule biosynthesis
MSLEQLLEQQRKEKLYRKNPELQFPAALPEDVLEEFKTPSKSDVRITFIVPFRGANRLSQLNKCINNLIERYPNCEILLIEDSNAPVIKQAIPDARYMFVYNKKLFNKSKSFNIGFLAATNDVICGIDADMLIPSTLIDLTINKINEDKVVFPGREIYYAYEWIDPKDLTQKFWYHKTWTRDRAATQFHGGIFICNKKTYAKVGGFDQRFEGYGSEDTSFYMRCVESKNNADTTRVMDLIHIDHDYNEVEQHAIETNRRLLIIYSRVNADERIIDCKKHNIFHNS